MSDDGREGDSERSWEGIERKMSGDKIDIE